MNYALLRMAFYDIIREEMGAVKLVYHNVIINVQDNTNNCVLDIYQDDGNSHEIMFKLVDGNGFFNVTRYTPEIRWYNEETKKTTVSTAVRVVNGYRGYLSYLVGNSLLKDLGRYTVTLNLSIKCPKKTEVVLSNLSFKFVVNVVKNFDHVDSQTEVTITKEFYDKLCVHLNNKLIHLSRDDRTALNNLKGIINYIVLNKPDSDQDIVKVLSEREDFVQFILDITKVDPAVIDRLINDVDELKIDSEALKQQLGELVRTREGEEPVTNIEEFVETYPKWYVFAPIQDENNISDIDDDDTNPYIEG